MPRSSGTPKNAFVILPPGYGSEEEVESLPRSAYDPPLPTRPSDRAKIRRIHYLRQWLARRVESTALKADRYRQDLRIENLAAMTIPRGQHLDRVTSRAYDRLMYQLTRIRRVEQRVYTMPVKKILHVLNCFDSQIPDFDAVLWYSRLYTQGPDRPTCSETGSTESNPMDRGSFVG